MPITTYTTYAEVRAALGVSHTELTDLVLSQSQWATLLDFDLEDIGETLPTLYTDIAALPLVNRSTDQQRFYDLTRLYASYFLAKSLLATLPMFSVLSLTDGRAEFKRQADIFDDVNAGVSGMYANIRNRLLKAYAKLDSTVDTTLPASLVYAVNTGLGVNPVTNG